MHCSSCELLIKDELTSLPGVSEVTIDHKTGKGLITIDDGKVSQHDILVAITKAGYTGVIESGDDTQTEKDTVEFIKKGAKSKDPMRVVFQSHITADGQVTENEEGKLSFQGEVDNKKTVEVVISNDPVIHWIADIKFGTRLIEYYPWTYPIPEYNKEINYVFTQTPPEFVIDTGLNNKIPLEAFVIYNLKNKYIRVNDWGCIKAIYFKRKNERDYKATKRRSE